MRQSLRTIGALGPDDPLGTIAVFNPTPQPATGYVTATVPWSDAQPVVAVIGPDGERIAARADRRRRSSSSSPKARPPGFDRARAEIGFVAADVPGYGYKIYRLETAAARAPPRAHRRPGARSRTSISAVEADAADGTLTVLDKRSGRALRRPQPLRRRRRPGDEYNYCAPETETLVDRPASPPPIRVESARGRAVADDRDDVPRCRRASRADRASRSAATVERAHRLDRHADRRRAARRRAHRRSSTRPRTTACASHFPSGVRTDVSKADQHFGVIERPIALPEWDPETWMEQPMGTYPQKAFVSVDDGAFGLTIANRGLPEYEVLDAPDGADDRGHAAALRRLALARRHLVAARRRRAAAPHAGRADARAHVFDYSIIPHAGDWAAAERARRARCSTCGRCARAGTATASATSRRRARC